MWGLPIGGQLFDLAVIVKIGKVLGELADPLISAVTERIALVRASSLFLAV